MGNCFGGNSSSKGAPGTGGPGGAGGAGAGDSGITGLPGCDLLRVIGQGTFGTVALVRERKTGHLYALKIMNKNQLISEDQLQNVATEREILRDAGPHPFVVECKAGFQTESAVVLVLEYLSGGDFYDLLKNNGLLDERQAKFYLAEIVVGIGELHAHNFVLRDLKLENVLLDSQGHIRLTDFGLSGKVQGIGDDSIIDLSGTAIYQAPEILSKKGHGTGVDWWALGVLAFIMMTGKPPFNNADRTALYNDIQNKELSFDDFEKCKSWSLETKDFIRRLLSKDPNKRLGKHGVQEVMTHPFFAGIDYHRLLQMELEPPITPFKVDTETKNIEAQRSAREELKKKLQAASKAKDKKGVYKILHDFEEVHVAGRASVGLDFDNKRGVSARTFN